MFKFKVTLGLGRMGNHFPKSIEVLAKSEEIAQSVARYQYHQDLIAEIGADHPIRGKYLTIMSIDKILEIA
jgi:hypothetical protein